MKRLMQPLGIALVIVTAVATGLFLRSRPGDSVVDSVNAPPTVDLIRVETPEECALSIAGSGVLLEISGSGALGMCAQWRLTRHGYAEAMPAPNAVEVCSRQFGQLRYTIRDLGGARASADYICSSFP